MARELEREPIAPKEIETESQSAPMPESPDAPSSASAPPSPAQPPTPVAGDLVQIDYRGWGPLALCMAASERPDLLAAAPTGVDTHGQSVLASGPDAPRRRRGRALALGGIVLLLCVATWAYSHFIR
jgi:hypothetical protein